MTDRPKFDATPTLEVVRFARKHIGEVMQMYAAYRDRLRDDAREEIESELRALAAEITLAISATPQTGPAS